MSTEHLHTTHGGGPGEDDAENATPESATVQINTTGVDDLLDEIDELLEEDAEEFVRSYVQKGGQ